MPRPRSEESSNDEVDGTPVLTGRRALAGGRGSYLGRVRKTVATPLPGIGTGLEEGAIAGFACTQCLAQGLERCQSLYSGQRGHPGQGY